MTFTLLLNIASSKNDANLIWISDYSGSSTSRESNLTKIDRLMSSAVDRKWATVESSREMCKKKESEREREKAA